MTNTQRKAAKIAKTIKVLNTQLEDLKSENNKGQQDSTWASNDMTIGRLRGSASKLVEINLIK